MSWRRVCIQGQRNPRRVSDVIHIVPWKEEERESWLTFMKDFTELTEALRSASRRVGRNLLVRFLTVFYNRSRSSFRLREKCSWPRQWPLRVLERLINWKCAAYVAIHVENIGCSSMPFMNRNFWEMTNLNASVRKYITFRNQISLTFIRIHHVSFLTLY